MANGLKLRAFDLGKQASSADVIYDALRDAIRIWVRARYDGHDGPAQVASYRAFGMLLGPLRRVGP